MAHDPPIDKHRALAGHPLFGQLSNEERERLVTYMRAVRHPARHTLFDKGDPGSNMMLVLRGRVKICTHSEEGKELVLNLDEHHQSLANACRTAHLSGDDTQAQAQELTRFGFTLLA